VDALKSILRGTEVDGALDLAAFQLVTLEDPDFDPIPYLQQLDGWAKELCGLGVDALSGSEFLLQYNLYFFQHLGFHGNFDDYYSPRNSFLNHVMDQRKGIPISLSVLYMELARRIGHTIQGIGFPGHFLVKPQETEYDSFVDVYHFGRQLSRQDCIQMGITMTGIDHSDRPQLLQPVSARSILMRMLQNLRGIYLTRRSNRKLLAVQDLLLLAVPDDADELFSRAMVKMNLHMHASAERDLNQFLQLSPASELGEEVKKQLALVRMMRSQMN